MAYAFNDDKSKFDLDETIDNVDNLIGNMAVIETSPVITNHSTGEYIMYNGILLEVLSPIATGENLILGTNVTTINFGDQLKALQDSVELFTTANKWIESGDCNNLTTPGVYSVKGTVINLPTASNFTVLVLTPAIRRVLQIVIAQAGNGTYVRHNVEDSWSTWKSLSA